MNRCIKINTDHQGWILSSQCKWYLWLEIPLFWWPILIESVLDINSSHGKWHLRLEIPLTWWLILHENLIVIAVTLTEHLTSEIVWKHQHDSQYLISAMQRLLCTDKVSVLVVTIVGFVVGSALMKSSLLYGVRTRWVPDTSTFLLWWLASVLPWLSLGLMTARTIYSGVYHWFIGSNQNSKAWEVTILWKVGQMFVVTK